MISSIRMILAICYALAQAATVSAITVTNTADSGPGSLRQAIADAVNGDLVDFDSSLNGDTITLTSGSLEITALQVHIDASNLSSGISLSGNDATRVFTITSNSTAVLSNLTIHNGNKLGGSGGGMAAVGGQLTMNDCTIRDCFATNNGGGAYIGNGIQATLNRCRFLGNRGDGFGGGIFFIGTTSALVTNTVIAGNRSQNGGGIYNLTDSPSIINCSIQGNLGAGIGNDFSSAPIFKNTIVWGNRIGSGTGALAPQQLKNISASNPSVSFCLIEGASGSGSFNDGNKVSWDTNNLDGTLISNNPEFYLPVLASSTPNPSANLRFLTGSSVINKGDNLSAPAGPDLAQQTRIQNSNIDLGAYEGGYATFAHLHPTLLPGSDENGNGRPNFQEYAMGLNPSAPDDPSALPAFSFSGGNAFLTLSQRSNALDSSSIWQTSTSIGNWTPMISGTHYLLESTLQLTPDRQQITLRLIEADPFRFYRQGFTQAD